jgi:hypothetical protein
VDADVGRNFGSVNEATQRLFINYGLFLNFITFGEELILHALEVCSSNHPTAELSKTTNGYLTMLAVLRLHSIDGARRIMNERGAVVGK